MIQVLINMVLMASVLYLVDTQLLESNKHRNIIMFGVTTLVCLAMGSFIAHTLKFSSTSLGAVILVVMSFAFGAWVGYKHKIMKVIRKA